jgi:cytochrome P450
MGLDFNVSVMPYGQVWRTSRKLLHTHLHQGIASKYQSIQMASARKLVQDILVVRQDVGMVSHVVRASFGRMMMKMVYGIDKEEAAKEQLSLAETVIEAFGVSITPGHFLVDFLTFCKPSCYFFIWRILNDVIQ